MYVDGVSVATRSLADVIKPVSMHRFGVLRPMAEPDTSELDTLIEQALSLELTNASAIEMVRWYLATGKHTVRYYGLYPAD